MTDTPQVLLAHHLKTLKHADVPARIDKLARQCAIRRLCGILSV